MSDTEKPAWKPKRFIKPSADMEGVTTGPSPVPSQTDLDLFGKDDDETVETPEADTTDAETSADLLPAPEVVEDNVDAFADKVSDGQNAYEGHPDLNALPADADEEIVEAVVLNAQAGNVENEPEEVEEAEETSEFQETVAETVTSDADKAAAEKAGLISQITSIAVDYNLDEDTLYKALKAAFKAAKPVAPKKSTAGTTVAKKYRDPATGAEWSGRGREPLWIKDQTRDKFLIKA